MPRLKEGRCPDCGDYCIHSPTTGRFYCDAHGWFDADRADHIVRKAR